MTYTEQDVERVAEAMKRRRAEYRKEREGLWGLFDPSDEDLARAALEAIEREPLEDVVHDLHPGTKICHVWPLLEGGYEAEIGVPVRQDRDGWWDHERSRGEGATIDEAIRAAVAAAQGDE